MWAALEVTGLWGFAEYPCTVVRQFEIVDLGVPWLNLAVRSEQTDGMVEHLLLEGPGGMIGHDPRTIDAQERMFRVAVSLWECLGGTRLRAPQHQDHCPERGVAGVWPERHRFFTHKLEESSSWIVDEFREWAAKTETIRDGGKDGFFLVDRRGGVEREALLNSDLLAGQALAPSRRAGEFATLLPQSRLELQLSAWQASSLSDLLLRYGEPGLRLPGWNSSMENVAGAVYDREADLIVETWGYWDLHEEAVALFHRFNDGLIRVGWAGKPKA